MSLLPSTLIPANYVNSAVINAFKTTTKDFTTAQDGEGFRITNIATGGYLEIASAGFVISPDGIATFTIDPTNLTALVDNATPNILGINNELIIQNADTLPTEIIGIEAGTNGSVGSIFGISYTSALDQDFVFQTTNDNLGGVLFNQFGLGSTTTQTKIKQGVITCSDTASLKAITINTNVPSITITDGTNTNTLSATAGGSNLQAVLNAGNTATGTSASVILNNTTIGGAGNPQLNLTNSSATAGNTNGVPYQMFNKTGRNGVQNDIIGTTEYFARNYLGTIKSFGKIESVITNTNAPSGDDGALDFYTCVNGTSSLVLRLNGADNENNTFRPLDMNGQDLKTSSGNMNISTASSAGTGNLTINSKATLTETALGIALNSTGTAGDAITLTSFGNINLIPASGGGGATASIRTDSDIQTRSVAGGSKIDFQGGNPDERFNIDKNDISLFWNNAITDTAIITLENDLASLNSAINMNYTTGSGDVGTSIQNIPSSQRILQTDAVNNKSYESSPNKVLLNEGAGRQAKIENSVNSGENRMDLFYNQGSGVVAQSGIVNTAGSQLLYLTHTDNAVNKAVSVRQDTSGTGKVQYDNIIDNSAFEITSVNTDLKLSAPSTGGSGANIELIVGGQLKLTGAGLQTSSSTGSSGQYLVIDLNGTTYKIALDNN